MMFQRRTFFNQMRMFSQCNHKHDHYHPIKISENEYKEVAWGIAKQGEKHQPMWIPRGHVGDEHVKFDLMFSGICHSDCHYGHNEFNGTRYPIVAGHEFLGKVTEVGSKVKEFKVGDIVGTGVLVDSCLGCPRCNDGDENYCDNVPTRTYNGARTHGRVPGNKELPTYGGYSASNVVHERFVVKIPEGLPLEAAGPIMCAGTTMYDPMKYWGCTDGTKKTIGIVGIGGLGTIGIKIARALGHDVIAISNTDEQREMAKEKGATDFVVSNDASAMKELSHSCNLILNTVSAPHRVQDYFQLLQKNGTVVQIGLVTEPQSIVFAPQVLTNRYSVAGSFIGGVTSMKEVLQLCADHKIWPDVETVGADKIDWVWDKLMSPDGNKDGIRYVIDVQKSL